MHVISAPGRLLAAAALSIVAGTAQANITTFTDRAAFLAALDTYGIDNFDDIPFYTTGPSLNRNAGAFTYTAGSSSGYLAVGTDKGDEWLSTWSETPLELSNFSSGVTAVGGYFFSNDYYGDYVSSPIAVTATDANDSITLNNASPGTGNFFGFITDSAFTQIRSVSGSPTSERFAAINDLVVGVATAPVPEPEGYALMLAGLATLGAAARRRRG